MRNYKSRIQSLEKNLGGCNSLSWEVVQKSLERIGKRGEEKLAALIRGRIPPPLEEQDIIDNEIFQKWCDFKGEDIKEIANAFERNVWKIWTRNRAFRAE